MHQVSTTMEILHTGTVLGQVDLLFHAVCTIVTIIITIPLVNVALVSTLVSLEHFMIQLIMEGTLIGTVLGQMVLLYHVTPITVTTIIIIIMLQFVTDRSLQMRTTQIIQIVGHVMLATLSSEISASGGIISR